MLSQWLPSGCAKSSLEREVHPKHWHPQVGSLGSQTWGTAVRSSLSLAGRLGSDDGMLKARVVIIGAYGLRNGRRVVKLVEDRSYRYLDNAYIMSRAKGMMFLPLALRNPGRGHPNCEPGRYSGSQRSVHILNAQGRWAVHRFSFGFFLQISCFSWL